MGATPTPPQAEKLPFRDAPSLRDQEYKERRPYKGLRHGVLLTKHAQVASMLVGKKDDEVPEKVRVELKALEEEINERFDLAIPQEAP